MDVLPKALSIDELDVVREAGASPEFLSVAAFDPGQAGAKENSPVHGVRKYAAEGTLTEGDLDSFDPGSHGSFFEALWDGYLGVAFIKADIDNIRLLLAVFSTRYLIERVVADDDMDAEYAARLVSERIERHTQPASTVNPGP